MTGEKAMEQQPSAVERLPITWREEALWTLFGLTLLVVFVALVIQDQI